MTDSTIQDDTTTEITHPERREQQTQVRQQQQQQEKQYVILFYKYHPLSDNEQIMEQYRSILQKLCVQLNHLKGRILIGCSVVSEGINGTISGSSYESVAYFTYALLGQEYYDNNIKNKQNIDVANNKEPKSIINVKYEIIIQQFWEDCTEFFTLIQQPVLRMNSPNDFKWSVVDDTDDESTGNSTTNNNNNNLFPDLNVKLVKELIGTGGLLSSITIDDVAQGYLTPQQWHDKLRQIQHDQQNNNNNNDTIVIDCRNTKEYEIGHFDGALNPNTVTYSQFPQWVQNHSHLLESKKEILMYCTGGIRCEKASAYIRQSIPNTKSTSVYHLQGGIHKYLEVYDANNNKDDNNNNEPFWKGKNFVFDSRVAAKPNTHGLVSTTTNNNHDIVPTTDGTTETTNDPNTTTTTSRPNDTSSAITTNRENKSNSSSSTSMDCIVGRCLRCKEPYDYFDPACVCTVCREPVLVCTNCKVITNKPESDSSTDSTDTTRDSSQPVRHHLQEYHCKDHYNLRNCYYTNLQHFTVTELQQQISDLQYYLHEIAIGRKFKQRRKTLQKQINKIQNEITNRHDNGDDDATPFLISTTELQSESITLNKTLTNRPTNIIQCRNCGEEQCSGRCWGFFGLKRKAQSKGHPTTDSSVTVPSKTISVPRKEQTTGSTAKIETSQHNLFLPPSYYRDPSTGIRVLPCTTRYISCNVKGKWCGESVLRVVQKEYIELTKPNVLQNILKYGLLRVNDNVISEINIADIKLKSSDTIGRLLHWHEAPVLVPEVIGCTKVTLPTDVLEEGKDIEDTIDSDRLVYICNKPSTVPVHPAGPYYWNTLTSFIEAQEGLQHQSLKTIHRTDRVTSGLTLFCTSVSVARLFHQCLTENHVHKLYIAQVGGRFPSSSEELGDTKDGSIQLDDETKCIRVDAPIYTEDIANGVRTVDPKGKKATSLFQLLSYDSHTNRSIVLCDPITGRNHQLRVHLQFLGFPIMGDVQYGGQVDSNLDHKEKTIDMMLRRIENDTTIPINGISNIPDVDADSARKACPSCIGANREAIINSFTSAQLLECGHAIHLHALKYKVLIGDSQRSRTKRNKKKHPNNDDPIRTSARDQVQEKVMKNQTELDFEVDLPDWATYITKDTINWLRPIIR